MSTIARMLVEMAGDPSGLRRAFRESVADAQAYGKDLRTAVNTGPLVNGAMAANAGRDAAKSMVQALTRQYNTDMATAREQMARGIISANDFKQAGNGAAVAFNHELLNGISDLRNNQMLPASVHAKLVKELKDAGMEAGKEARTQMIAELNKTASDLNGIAGGLKSAGTMLTASVTAPIVGFGAVSVKTATDAAEAFNKFQVLFGQDTDSVSARLAQMHNTIPATTVALKNMASNFQGLLVPMGFTSKQAADMSLRLVQLGGDLTSLHHIPVQETMDRLFSALVGQARSIRRFGVDISDAHLAELAFANGMGTHVEALTRAQRTQLIFNEIIRATSVATGDAAATAGSAANQFRFLQRDAAEVSLAFGQRLLPTIIPLISSLNRVLESIAKLSPATLDTIIKFGLMAAAVGPILIGLGMMVGVIAQVVTAMAVLEGGATAGGIVGLLASLTGPVGLVVGLGLAGIALAAWVNHAQSAKQDVDALARSFQGMNAAQLMARLGEENTRMADLRRQQAEAEKTAGGVGTGGKAEDAMGVGRGMGEITQRVAEQQALISGLHTALVRLDGERAAAAATEATNLARTQAMYKTLGEETDNALAKFKEAQREGKEAKKEQLEFIQQLAASTTGIGDLYKEAVKFHQPLAGIEGMAVQAFRTVSDAIDAAGGRFDANTARLYNMRKALEEIRAVALSPWGLALPSLVNTPNVANAIPTAQQAIHAQETRRLQQGGDFYGVGPQNMPAGLAVAPPLEDDTALRLRIAFEDLRGAVSNVAGKLREMVAPIATALGGILNPIRFFGSVFTEMGAAITPVLEPLVPIFTELAAVVANALAPVFKALAPVLQELIPVVAAVVQVIAPILTALVPLIRAFIPLLDALFPIFKAVAIAATYIGQAFGNAASIVLRAVGNIVIGFGTIILQLAKAIDALPFVSAGHAMDVAQGIIDWGRGLLTTSDDFRDMANAMVDARGQIEQVNLQGAADGANNLAAATNAAAEAMLSVPEMFRFRTRLVEQWNERDLVGSGGDSTSTSAPAGPTDTTPSIPGSGGTFVVQGDVVIHTSGDGGETLDNMREEARRRAMATSGQTSRAYEAFQ